MNLEKAKKILEKHYQKQLKEVKSLKDNKSDLEWIKMKKIHSFQVLEIGKTILENSNEFAGLSNENKIKAEIIFLFHDIGRFYEIGDSRPTDSKVQSTH